MKAMSIIGIILFSIFTITYFGGNVPPEGSVYEDAYYSGLFGVLFGLALSITCLVYVRKRSKKGSNYNYVLEISKLGELKEKGLMTEEEFEMRKKQLLLDI
ncbi:MAG TPA: SHOCT domain-containing protein [Kaistella chaponensis]|uniref:SHOCT domain-containing protein n=1 Tax=Kaistella chaponensis TaxID=713588 RepID=UPI002C9A52C6|nr:SHOCT domain-containing protein [Kaistella chaponensis]HPW87760.1 SHOCT domain-containing protein [Kaistella chaponensis]